MKDNKRSAVNYLLAQNVRDIWDAKDTLGEAYMTRADYMEQVHDARKDMRRLNAILEEPTARQREISERICK